MDVASSGSGGSGDSGCDRRFEPEYAGFFFHRGAIGGSCRGAAAFNLASGGAATNDPENGGGTATASASSSGADYEAAIFNSAPKIGCRSATWRYG